MSHPTSEVEGSVAASTSTPPHVDSQPHDLSAAECRLLLAAQTRLDQQRRNNQASAEAAHDFARALRSNEQQTLPFAAPAFRPGAASIRPQKAQQGREAIPVRLGRFETPSRPGGAATIPPTLDAALERARRVQPGSPAALTQEAVERARPIIETAAKRHDARRNLMAVFEALALAAYTYLGARGHSPLATSCTLFTVLETLQIVTGLSSDQCERATRRLQDLGLIHKASGALPTGEHRMVTDKVGRTHQRKVYQGGTWTTTEFTRSDTGERVTVPARAGTWLCVLLRPAPGLRAQVRAHELPECPRDLTADRKVGRTAWQMIREFKERLGKVRESSPSQGSRFEITPLLLWALPKSSFTESVTGVDTRRSAGPGTRAAATSAQDVIWGLGRILHEHPQHRREAIQETGRTLAAIFRDAHSVRHYWRILWRATAAEYAGLDAYQEVQREMAVTLAEMTELQMTNPGGWLVQRLKKCAWWDAVYRAVDVMPQPAA